MPLTLVLKFVLEANFVSKAIENEWALKNILTVFWEQALM